MKSNMGNVCKLFNFLLILQGAIESDAAIAPKSYESIENQVKNTTGGFILTISTKDPNFIPTLELILKEERDDFLDSPDLTYVTGQIKSEEINSAWGSIQNGKFFGKFIYNTKTFVIEDPSMFGLQKSMAIIFEEGNFDDTKLEKKNVIAPNFTVIRTEEDKINQASYSWTPSTGSICKMKITIANGLFNNIFEKKVNNANRVVKQYEKSLNQIYRNNDIKIGGNYFEFKVVKIDIHDDDYCQSNPSSVSCIKYWSRDKSEEFLESHALTDHSDYCLSFLWADHDFAGTLGIAYVEAICNPYRRTRVKGSIKSLSTNSGFITFHGSRSSETHVHTWAHEVGHNMGSNHDSEGNGCPSSGYLMAAYAPRSVKPQDKEFSHCSQKQINDALRNIRKDYNRQCLQTKTALAVDVTENPHKYGPGGRGGPKRYTIPIIRVHGTEKTPKNDPGKPEPKNYTIHIGVGVSLFLILIIGVFVVCLATRRDIGMFKTKPQDKVKKDSNDRHEYNKPPNVESPPNIRPPPNNRITPNILTPTNTRTPPTIPKASNSRLPPNIGWNNQPQTGRHMGSESWQAGEMGREEAETKLERARKGEFIMRTSKGLDVLSVKDHGRVRHIKLQREGGKYTGDNQNYFDSLQQFISYYKQNEIPNTNIILI